MSKAKGLNAIYQWVIRTMMKDQTGVMQTLPKKDLVDLNVQITAQRLMQEGVNPTNLKNANQVENAINIIENKAKTKSGITQTKTAEVFDLEGKKIKKTDNIMGGREIPDEDLPPPGSRGEADDIAAPVQSAEQSIKDMIQAENRKNIAKIKNKKMVKDAVDNMSPAFVKGDRKYNAQLVAEDLAQKKFGKEFYDLDQRQQMDLYGEALDGLSVDPDKFSQGGRAEFKSGLGPKFLNFLKSFKKEKPFSGKEFMDKRKFIKADKIENKIQQIKNEKFLKEAREEFKKNPPFKFPQPGSKEYEEGLAKIQRALIEDRKLNAEGGRAEFKSGLGKRFLEILKGKPKIKFDEKKFREGPINLDFLENIDKKDLEKFIRTRDTMGPGGYGMYDDFADMPAGLRAAELIKTIKTKDGGINYKAAELFLGKKLKGDESADELIQILNRQEMRAEGGRIGLKEGMNRRTFLKLLGGMAAIPIVGKFLKPLKTAKGITKVPIIKTDNVPGKPEWFDALVNKVIIEGDDVTKRFATAERQSIHQKTLDNGAVVRVTEDIDDGAVRVEYDSPDNVFEDTVQMQYKKPLPDEGDPRPTAEFTTAESGPVGRQTSPDDYDIDIDEVGGTSIRDLDSDVSKLKEYATGQKQTLKEFVESKKRRDKAKAITEDPEAQSDAVIRRQGDYDGSEYDDYASGGIARMLGE